MFSESKIKFLFKCKECNLIVSISLDDEVDIEKVREDETELECPCGGKCVALRD